MNHNWPDRPTDTPLGDGRHAARAERPGSIEQLREVVHACRGEGLAVYPQGGRTALDHGGIPARPGVAVSTTALDQVLDYPAADMTITIQAGMTLASLQALLATNNQRLPLDAPRADVATLGGIYATATCGPRRFGAGRPRDQVLGVSFVTSDGEVVSGGGRVVKNVAGYDFPKLLTGSLGTLGILTQMTLKVPPRPEASALVWLAIDTAEHAARALDRLNTSATRPIALELLNRLALGPLASERGLAEGPWAIVLGFEDNAASVAWQVDQVRREFPEHAVTAFQGPDAGPLWSRLIEAAEGPAVDLMFQANVRPSAVVAFCARLDPAAWAVQAHAGNGIVLAQNRAPADLEAVQRTITPLRAAAVEAGGNLTLVRCPTDWKTALSVWGQPRADWSLMAKLKSALDPSAMMNPGRFAGTI